MDSRDLQQQISESVARRGYRDGWTAAQFLARQVAKLTEELGESAACIDPQGDGGTWALMDNIAVRGQQAGRHFDNPRRWDGDFEIDLDRLRSEVADIQVVLCNIAAAIEEITSEPFNLLQAAASKARADEARGRRG